MREVPTGLDTSISKIGIFIGLVVLAVGITLTAWNATQLASMGKVDGLVVKHEKGMKGFWPFVRYTVDGTDYVVGSKIEVEGMDRGFEKGDTVAIFFPADDPADGRLGLFFDLWFTSILVTGVGACFFTLGWILGLGKRNVLLVKD